MDVNKEMRPKYDFSEGGPIKDSLGKYVNPTNPEAPTTEEWKRYKEELDSDFVDSEIVEDPFGEWVKYDDVKDTLASQKKKIEKAKLQLEKWLYNPLGVSHQDLCSLTKETLKELEQDK